MPISRSQTGVRLLRVLETMAEHQPIGVRALARLIGDDKSAVHRAIVTLVDEGWVRLVSDSPVRWEVSPRILTVAERAHGAYALKRRVRPALERLRDECGETVVLIAVDIKSFVVADVVESTQMLRVVPPIGSIVPSEGTAGSRILLPYFSRERQTQLLGKRPDRKLLEHMAIARKAGFAFSERDDNPAVAAAIIEPDGQPSAAVAVIGPAARMTPDRLQHISARLVHTVALLSRGVPIDAPPATGKANREPK
jgi:IclR family acetate operon transcriptional repressor